MSDNIKELRKQQHLTHNLLEEENLVREFEERMRRHKRDTIIRLSVAGFILLGGIVVLTVTLITIPQLINLIILGD